MMFGWFPFMFLGPFFSLVVLAGIGFLVYAAVTHVRPVPNGTLQPGGVERPIDVLRLRYARGELTREEFQRMREDLQRQDRP
jgi:putative membrane protein